MNIDIKTLTLYKNLVPTFAGEKFFSSNINLLNPQKPEDESIKLNELILLQKEYAEIIEGKYLFCQVPVQSEADNKTNELNEKTLQQIKKAAGEVYLESLWQQLNFEENKIYIRKLEEHSCPVIQIFWKLKTE